MKNNFVEHPWLKKYPILPENKYLIIGTHPPMPYCGRISFYYGNMNEFWRFLDAVYPGKELYNAGCPEVEKIIRFLDFKNISITDMVESTNGDPFSTDEEMKVVSLNNSLFEQLMNGNIETIYFTSAGGRNSALSLFRKWSKHNKLKELKIPDHKIWRDKGLNVKLFGRKIKLEVLFSPSPSARRSSNKIVEFQKFKSNNPSSSFDDFRIDWYKRKLPPL
jgi:G:T/U-mismatch repair DNA glycosylase